MEEQEFYTKLGERCKELREAAGITPGQMVKKTGLSRSLLYEFETTGKKISAFRLNKVLKTLGLSNIEDALQPEKKTLSKSAFPCQPIMA